MYSQTSVVLVLYLALQALDMGFGVQKVIVVAAQPLLELLDLRRGLLVQLLLLCVLKDIDTTSFTQPPNDALCPFIDPIIHPCAHIHSIVHLIQAHYLTQTR